MKKLPTTETGPSLRCFTKSGQQYLITQNPAAAKFTLWRVMEGGYDKLATSNSPVSLSNKVPWND